MVALGLQAPQVDAGRMRLAAALLFALRHVAGHVQKHVHALDLGQLAAQLAQVSQLLALGEPCRRLAPTPPHHPPGLRVGRGGGLPGRGRGGGGFEKGGGVSGGLQESGAGSDLFGAVLAVEDLERSRLERHVDPLGWHRPHWTKCRRHRMAVKVADVIVVTERRIDGRGLVLKVSDDITVTEPRSDSKAYC